MRMRRVVEFPTGDQDRNPARSAAKRAFEEKRPLVLAAAPLLIAVATLCKVLLCQWLRRVLEVDVTGSVFASVHQNVPMV